MDQTIISHPQTHTPYGNNFLHCDGKLLLHCYMRKNKRSITPCIKCLIGVGLSQRKVCRLTNISICTLNRFLNQEYDKRCKLAALQWAFQNKEKQSSIGKKWLQNNKNHHRLRVADWRKKIRIKQQNMKENSYKIQKDDSLKTFEQGCAIFSKVKASLRAHASLAALGIISYPIYHLYSLTACACQTTANGT